MLHQKEYSIKDAVSAVIDYRGKTPKKLGGNWSSDGYRTFSAKNIKTGHIVHEDTVRCISKDIYHKWMKEEIKKGDILITSEAPFGQVFYWDSDEKIVLGQRLFAIRINENFYPKYIYFYMTSKAFQAELGGHATGTTVMGLRQPELMKCKIKAPDYYEQKKIGDLLWSIERKINLNEKLNQNLEQQAKAQFFNWLTYCDDTITIGEIANNIIDYTQATSRFVKLLNSSDVTKGVFPHVNYVENINLKGHFKKRFQFRDILYSEIRPRNQHYGYVLFDAKDFIASTRLMVIRANLAMTSSAMLYQYLLLEDVRSEFTLKTESRSGTFPQGNYSDLASIVVPYSPLNNQKNIDKMLETIRMTIYNNQVENEKLSLLRDTLLPKLISGEIDVSNLNI